MNTKRGLFQRLARQMPNLCKERLREATSRTDEMSVDGLTEDAMDYRTLITMGRKAGLRTTELYQALAARRPEVGDRITGQADSNGFIPAYGPNGQRIYRPQSGQAQP